MNRRDFLKTVGFGSLSLTLGTSVCSVPVRASASNTAGGGSATNRKPNLLVIMSDEHNAGVLGCCGNRIIQTPNLDKLAAGGTTFQNCYTNSPLCVPSRLAFTSGKYISRVGAWNNSCWLPSADYPSLPRILNAAGYESVLCGKMHYDSTRRYGFREIGGNMNNNVKSGRGNRRRPDDLTPTSGLSERFNDFHAGDDSGILNHDRKVTAGTVDFLEHRQAGDKPFFLLAGYLAPHFPLTVPQEYWDHYKGKVPMPVIPAGHLESLPRNYRHLRIGFNVEDAPEDVVRKGRELYYGLTEWLDNEVGKVLAALARSAAADNTVVIYTTDHGENMGEHGLWWKNALFENAARVPLIVSWPARWKGAQRRVGACSLVDVVQTIAQIGGAKVPRDWNGDSMVPWLDNPQTRWKDKAVSEYYAHNITSGYAMIRMGRFKYVYHTPADATHPAERELYDLEADPGEFRNLANDPSQKDRVQQMHAALVAELGEEPDKTEQRCRADYQRGYDRPDQNGKKQKQKQKQKQKAAQGL